MNLNPFRRRVPEPTASDHARALGQVGRDSRKAHVRATTREICACIGMPVPAALQDKDA